MIANKSFTLSDANKHIDNEEYILQMTPTEKIGLLNDAKQFVMNGGCLSGKVAGN